MEEVVEQSVHPQTNKPSFDSQSAQSRQEELTKPKGSLGLLESISLQICNLQKTSRPVLDTAEISHTGRRSWYLRRKSLVRIFQR